MYIKKLMKSLWSMCQNYFSNQLDKMTEWIIWFYKISSLTGRHFFIIILISLQMKQLHSTKQNVIYILNWRLSVVLLRIKWLHSIRVNQIHSNPYWMGLHWQYLMWRIPRARFSAQVSLGVWCMLVRSPNALLTM